MDRVAWYDPVEARRRIKEPQILFLDRLEASLAETTLARPLPTPGPQTDRSEEP
jgi:predicted NUDIX family NTP pyrophosphohydrolase